MEICYIIYMWSILVYIADLYCDLKYFGQNRKTLETIKTISTLSGYTTLYFCDIQLKIDYINVYKRQRHVLEI